MCTCSHLVYLSHLLALGLGVMGLRELVRLQAPRWALIAGTGAMAAGMGLFLFHVSNPHIPFFDFTKAYWFAGHEILKGPDALRKALEAGAFGFVNLPIVAYLFAPFGLMTDMGAANVFLVLGIIISIWAWWLLVHAAKLDMHGAALLAFVFAAFGPLIYSLREGNTSHMILALAAGAFLLLRNKRDFLAGLLLGVAAVIKLPLLLFGVYFFLRGRWKVVAGGGVVILGTVLASLAVFGWDMHVLWYEVCVKPYTRDPIPALNVQSVAAALARFELGPNSILDWAQKPLSPVSRVIAQASTFLMLGLAAFAALAPRPQAARDGTKETAREIEFLIVLMLAVAASPLTWSHYYSWMLMPAAFFIGRTQHFSQGIWTRIIGWAAIAIASPPVLFWQPDNALLAELHARLGVSHLLYGGLIMLGLLMWSRWTLREAKA